MIRSVCLSVCLYVCMYVYMYLFLIFSFTLKMENSILDYLTNQTTLTSTLQGCHFTTPISQDKCSMGALEQSFLEFLEQPVKFKIFLILVISY